MGETVSLLSDCAASCCPLALVVCALFEYRVETLSTTDCWKRNHLRWLTPLGKSTQTYLSFLNAFWFGYKWYACPIHRQSLAKTQPCREFVFLKVNIVNLWSRSSCFHGGEAADRTKLFVLFLFLRLGRHGEILQTVDKKLITEWSVSLWLSLGSIVSAATRNNYRYFNDVCRDLDLIFKWIVIESALRM